MRALHAILKPFEVFNDFVLPLGRRIAIVLIGLMVLAILIQVFFRYVLNNALPWPDEAARFAMLWLTGLIAPMAYRRGGFVAIDTLISFLSRRPAHALNLFLLAIAAVVLIFAVRIGWGELTSFMSRANTASLYVPFNFGSVCQVLDIKPTADTIWCRVPRLWAFASLWVGCVLLLIVNTELMIRSLIGLLGGEDDLKPLSLPEDELIAE
jgi:TRAP-type C4-dicarboxylate transport system permease small subunit